MTGTIDDQRHRAGDVGVVHRNGWQDILESTFDCDLTARFNRFTGEHVVAGVCEILGGKISDDTQAVIVPWKNALKKVAAIRERIYEDGPRFTRKDLRDLQRFMVNLHLRDFQALESMGLLQPLLPNMELRVLNEAAYHEHLGVVIDQRPTEDFLL